MRLVLWVHIITQLSLMFQVVASLNRTLAAKQEVNIVVYDKIRGYLNWYFDWFGKAALDNCDTRCVLSEYPKNFASADIVIFHAPTRDQSHPYMPQKKPAKSIYVLVSMEQPKYARILSDHEQLKSYDALMTYSLKSTYPGTAIPNIPITYFPLNIVSPSIMLQPPRPYADKNGYHKNVNVAVFTSNCHSAGATDRYNYLQEIMKHVDVHSYGRCFNNKKEPSMPEDPKWPEPAQKRARKVKVLSHYKFYLAFENLPVDDYVSEKVFEGFFAGSVPIYRGAKSIEKFLPCPGLTRTVEQGLSGALDIGACFINANEMSGAQVASLITYYSLPEHEKEYEKFFAFKKKPLPAEFEQIALMSYTHPNVLCRLCDYAVAQKSLST